MVSFFENAILKLQELGFFQFFLPFLLTAAIVYGGLRRAQLFGDPDKNIAVNGIVAFVISLFVWAAPIILGVDIESRLSAFFIQGISVSLIVLFGLIISSMFFPPDLAKNLSDRVKTPIFWGGIVIVALIIFIVILISSGLASVLFPRGVGVSISSATWGTIAAMAALVISLFIVVRAGGGK